MLNTEQNSTLKTIFIFRVKSLAQGCQQHWKRQRVFAVLMENFGGHVWIVFTQYERIKAWKFSFNILLLPYVWIAFGVYEWKLEKGIK